MNKGMDLGTSKEIYLALKEAFEANRDEARAIQMASYMRNRFAFYGLQSVPRRAVYLDFLKRERKEVRIDYTLLDLCWEDEHREFQYFAVDYLDTKRKYLTYDDVAHISKYAKTKQWWDTIDGLDRIIGGIAFVDDRVDALMLEWSRDEDFWLRRIAIDHQIGRKERTDTVLLEKIIVNNFGSNEFFINKAIGWSLREYGKTDPEWVRDFIERYGERMSRLSLREASKYL